MKKKTKKFDNFDLDPDILTNVRKGFKKDFSKIRRAIKELNDCLNDATSIDELMMAKTLFMRDALLAIMPSYDTCYFCQKHLCVSFNKHTKLLNCKACEYGQLKGVCNELHANSAYDKVMDQFAKLDYALAEYWSGNEIE